MKEQQKKHLIEMMQQDEELGLYEEIKENMTLKEKFKERLYNQSQDDSECLRIRFENIDKVIDSQEKIADDFAIGFAEWLDSDFYQGDDVNEYHKSILEYREGKIFTVKELLEIYKKKGL